MNKKLDQYKGTLTPTLAAEGINAARRNAAALVSDAELLLEAHRYPTAAALAALSIEESGKKSIIRGLLVSETPADIAECWREYRTHTAKNRLWIFLDLARRELSDGKGYEGILQRIIPEVADPNSDHPWVLEHLKQLGFYTDCLGDAHWSSPSEIVDESLATSLVQTARVLSTDKDTSVEEMEVWASYMRPVWSSTNLQTRRQAISRMYAELLRRGIVNDEIVQNITHWYLTHEAE